MEGSGTKAKQDRDVEWVYRISTQAEWEELQHKGSSLGGDLDRSTGCIHLSDLNQVSLSLSRSDSLVVCA